MISKDVLIVGAGVAGLSTAVSLARQGLKVLVIDRGATGQESSWAGAGILCPLLPWDYAPPVNLLALSGMHAWPDWAEGLVELSGCDPEYWACGMEVWGSPSPNMALAWCHEHNFPASTKQGNRLWLPSVAQVRNPRLINSLTSSVVALGGEVLTGFEISGLVQRGNKVISAVSGKIEYTADRFILATGAWAGQMLGALEPAPNIRPVRGQMLLYAPGSHSLDHILYQNGLYLVPRRDGHLLAGSTLEEVGFDARTTPEALKRLHETACDLLPTLRQHQPIRSWAGLRPGSPDNIPVIDRHPDYENVWVHTGHYRYGVTMAPASSRLLVELMLGKAPHLDPAPYSWQAALGRNWLKDEVAHD